MQKVEAMRYMYLLVLGLYPCKLVDNFIAPFVHAIVPYVHLRVQDPQEAKAFLCQVLYWNVDNFLVAHSAIL